MRITATYLIYEGNVLTLRTYPTYVREAMVLGE